MGLDGYSWDPQHRWVSLTCATGPGQLATPDMCRIHFRGFQFLEQISLAFQPHLSWLFEIYFLLTSEIVHGLPGNLPGGQGC